MPEYSAEDRSDRCTRTIRTARLQLSFCWGIDRWHHEVSVRSGAKWLRVAGSSELGPAPDRPGRVSCPAYQQFHYQDGDGRGFALLVGQSGLHHFSASFEVEDGPAASQIRVDVADRVRVDDPWLACTYLAFRTPFAMTVDAPARIAWEIPEAGRLTLSQAGPADRPSRVVVGELTREAKAVLAKM